MKTKTFDCVEMKRKGAELVQQRLAGMTRQQQLEYWRGQTELLRQRQAALRAQQPTAETPQ
jgi:hypothetical protein